MRNVRLAAGSDPPNPIIGDLVMDRFGFTQLPESAKKTASPRSCRRQPEAPPERVVAILYMPMSGLLLDFGNPEVMSRASNWLESIYEIECGLRGV